VRNEDAIVFFQHLVIVEIPFYVQGGLESDVTQTYETTIPVWKETINKIVRVGRKAANYWIENPRTNSAVMFANGKIFGLFS